MDLSPVKSGSNIAALGCCSRKVILVAGGPYKAEMFSIISGGSGTYVIGPDVDNQTSAWAFATFLNAQLALGTVQIGTTDGSGNWWTAPLISATYNSGTGHTTIVLSGTYPATSMSGACLYFTKIYAPATDTITINLDATDTGNLTMNWPCGLDIAAGSIVAGTLNLTGTGTINCYGSIGYISGGSIFVSGNIVGAGASQVFVYKPGSQIVADITNGQYYSSVSGCTVHNYSGANGELMMGNIADATIGGLNYVAATFQALYPVSS